VLPAFVVFVFVGMYPDAIAINRQMEIGRSITRRYERARGG
jgi:hypothetical protein